MKDPQTQEEWQEAVDMAEFYLALESARMYGLVVGGPEVNSERCLDILERGKLKGVRPSPDYIQRCIGGLV